MATVMYGTICDVCGAGSRDYAHDANPCEFCLKDYCDACAEKTKHTLIRDEGPEGCKKWDCEDLEPNLEACAYCGEAFDCYSEEQTMCSDCMRERRAEMRGEL